MPIRIQRRRTKGWKKPNNTVYVGRGTKFGNPFIVGKDGTHEEVVEKYKEYMQELVITDFDFEKLLPISQQPRWVTLNVAQLKGKNLMCFCDLYSPCHATELLKIANQ